MSKLNENNIEEFIRQNKENFDNYPLPDNHFNKFLFKLQYNVKRIISIVPYLIKVAIVTIIIFIASIIIWNNYIRKDRHEITLKEKIINIVSFKAKTK
jgi:hypothetical protein